MLIIFCCDAPFKVLLTIEQLPLSLPRHLVKLSGRVALLYSNNSFQLLSLAVIATGLRRSAVNIAPLRRLREIFLLPIKFIYF